jgi:hypothetical protein
VKELLKIQKGDVYVEIPADDEEALQYVIDVCIWAKARICTIKKAEELGSQEKCG